MGFLGGGVAFLRLGDGLLDRFSLDLGRLLSPRDRDLERLFFESSFFTFSLSSSLFSRAAFKSTGGSSPGGAGSSGAIKLLAASLTGSGSFLVLSADFSASGSFFFSSSFFLRSSFLPSSRSRLPRSDRPRESERLRLRSVSFLSLDRDEGRKEDRKK